MSNIAIAKKKEGSFDFKRQILYPACLTFTLILLVSYVIFMLLDFNVTETRDYVTYIRNGNTDTDTYDYKVGREFSLDVAQIIGFILFSFSLAALSLIQRTNYSKTFKRLIHFSGTMLAFFICVPVMSGTLSDSDLGFGTAMLVTFMAAAVYFALLGIKTLFKRFIHIGQSRMTEFLGKYLPPVFVIFTALVLIVMILGLFLKVQIIINKVGPDYPYDDRIGITTWETVITPLAPTLQNYLRYLGMSGAFMLGIAVLFSKLNKLVKVFLNFLINGSALVLLWIIQLDFFRELDNATLYAIVGFISLYLVILITVSVILFIRTRKREDEEEYENQFMPGKKSKKRAKPTYDSEEE